MEVRGVREAELEQTINLQCLVFRPDGHQRFWAYIRGDPSYRLDQTRVVVVDGRVVATLRVWDRRMRIGSSVVRMGGIGGVCTHPDYRGMGYATALMRDVVTYMRAAGYDLSVLFSIIPCRFYRRLGWASVPRAGFRLTGGRAVGLGAGDWMVQPFDEQRDLQPVVALYNTCNGRQSGAILRPRAYWDSAPARIRHVLPSVIARRQDVLGGYLNYRVNGTVMKVLEVAYDREDPTVLGALINHLLKVCAEHGLDEICGEIPHRHPFVAMLAEGSEGDLFLTGDASMMLYPVNLHRLLGRLVPALQSRLEGACQTFDPIAVCFQVDDQRCGLRLGVSGVLEVCDVDPGVDCVRLPAGLFWRTLLGESSWSQLEPTLWGHGISVTPGISALLSIIFPQQEVVFWAPDHY